MTFQKALDRSTDLAQYHLRQAKQAASRLDYWREMAEGKARRHNNRCTLANMLWNFRFHSKAAKEFAQDAERCAIEIAKQSDLFAAPVAQEADPFMESIMDEPQGFEEEQEQERAWSLEEIQAEYDRCAREKKCTAHIPDADTDALRAADTRKAFVVQYRGEQYDMKPHFNRFGHAGWEASQTNEQGGGLYIPCDTMAEAHKKMRWHIDQGIYEEPPQAKLFEAPNDRAAPAVIGAQLAMLQTVSDPQQLQLF